ncbi:hypothetical protein CARUB_v10011651mg, partial [Capsella rubella]
HALIDGYGLVGYLDGTSQIPPSTVTVATVVSRNPDFIIWTRQDRLLYSAIFGSVSPSVQSVLSRTTTTAEIWSTLAETYGKASRGHARQIKDQLKVWTKGTRTIDEYMHGVTTRFDTLAALDSLPAHDDQIETILNGLPEDYQPIIDQVACRDTSPSIAYVHERLRNHEARLLSKAASSSLVPASANVAQRHNNNNNNNRSGQHYNNNQKQYNASTGYTTNYQPQYDGRSQQNRVSKPYLGKCQICNTQGHSARRCPQFQSRMQPGEGSQYGGSTSSRPN